VAILKEIDRPYSEIEFDFAKKCRELEIFIWKIVA
jgi:hypothetical protein